MIFNTVDHIASDAPCNARRAEGTIAAHTGCHPRGTLHPPVAIDRSGSAGRRRPAQRRAMPRPRAHEGTAPAACARGSRANPDRLRRSPAPPRPSPSDSGLPVTSGPRRGAASPWRPRAVARRTTRSATTRTRNQSSGTSTAVAWSWSAFRAAIKPDNSRATASDKPFAPDTQADGRLPSAISRQ